MFSRWGRDFLHPSGPALEPKMGIGSFLGVKRPGLNVDHTPTSSAEVKERVELYLYSPSRPSSPLLERTLIYVYLLRFRPPSKSLFSTENYWRKYVQAATLLFYLFLNIRWRRPVRFLTRARTINLNEIFSFVPSFSPAWWIPGHDRPHLYTFQVVTGLSFNTSIL